MSQVTLSPSQSSVLNFNKNIEMQDFASQPTFSSEHPISAKEMQKPWHERSIAKIEDFEVWMERKCPNFDLQNRIDSIGRQLEAKFSKLNGFNQWLDSNGQGKWYQKVATFLAKLPVRTVRNVIRLLYSIIKCALNTAVHPAKAATKLAKLLVRLANELTKPESWTKMGSGMIGGTLGQFIITGNPYALIGIGIGGAMMLGGMSAGALKAALSAQDHKLEAVSAELLKHLESIPESMLTGFVMGLMFGAISDATRGQEVPIEHPKPTQPEYIHQYGEIVVDPTNFNQVAEWVRTEYMPSHDIPADAIVKPDNLGVDITWEGHQYRLVPQSYGDATKYVTLDYSAGNGVPNYPYGWSGEVAYIHTDTLIRLDDIIVNPPIIGDPIPFPTDTPVNLSLLGAGQIAAASTSFKV